MAGSCDSVSAVNLTSETSAENKDPIMMPERIIVVRALPFPERHVRLTATMPKKNAVSCTPISRNPRSSANAAPKLAPEATPSVSGVARGLAKRLWNTQPETDSPAPTSAASSTRGSRIDHRTALACAPTSRPSSSETRSRTGTFIRPMQRHTSAHRTGAIRNTTSCHRRRLPGIGCFFMLPPEKQKDRIPEQDTACPPMHARRKNASLSPQGRNVEHSRILASGSGGC